MLFIERDDTGNIAAIRRIQTHPEQESVSLHNEEVLAFFRSSGEVETLSQLLALSDLSVVRVVEDLVDLLIDKKLILFTELPPEAQKKIRERQQLRTRMGGDELMVEDIL